MKNISYIFIVLVLTFFSCRDVEDMDNSSNSLFTEYPDWTTNTHSNDVEPDYSVVFNQKEVLRFDITIKEDDWEVMQSDLASIVGSGNQGGPRFMEAGDMAQSSEEPMWVPCSFKFNDKEWYYVGVRYKGNSSLISTYREGLGKFSLKLDFDQFEGDYPALENQRFYGFKQLNLNNNYEDQSLMREKVGADLFRQFGLTSAQTAFCVVYVDYGDGPVYFGLYTLVEEVDDTVLDSQFANGSGNLYKPENDGATFANGTYNATDMTKKTNETEADYSDVKALYDILNSSDRTADTALWKANLEQVLDVYVFLKWLAANTVIQNWDTYGIMPHNYYLYNNPDNNLLTWIPWDNNEAFQNGKQGGALSLSLSAANDEWPLINYLINIPGYRKIYETYMHQFIDKVFIPTEMGDLYTGYYNLLKDYAYAEVEGYSFLNTDSDFDKAVNVLKNHAQTRHDTVTSYLQ